MSFKSPRVSPIEGEIDDDEREKTFMERQSFELEGLLGLGANVAFTTACDVLYPLCERLQCEHPTNFDRKAKDKPNRE